MEDQEKNPVQESTSLTESPDSPGLATKQSKRTRLQATIDHQIKKPAPFGPVFVHRIRNEGSEKDLPEGKWCDGKLLTAGEHGSVLDGDVTCPDCKQEILDRISQEAADAQKAANEQPRKCHICEYVETEGPPTIHTRDWATDNLCLDCDEKMRKQSMEPEPAPKPDNPKPKIKPEIEFLDKLEGYREKQIEMQEAEITALLDINQTLNDLSIEIKAFVDEIITLNAKRE